MKLNFKNCDEVPERIRKRVEDRQFQRYIEG